MRWQCYCRYVAQLFGNSGTTPLSWRFYQFLSLLLIFVLVISGCVYFSPHSFQNLRDLVDQQYGARTAILSSDSSSLLSLLQSVSIMNILCDRYMNCKLHPQQDNQVIRVHCSLWLFQTFPTASYSVCCHFFLNLTSRIVKTLQQALWSKCSSLSNITAVTSLQ